MNTGDVEIVDYHHEMSTTALAEAVGIALGRLEDVIAGSIRIDADLDRIVPCAA